MAVAPLPPFVWKILCGRRLAVLRERAGLTQAEVVARTGWSQATQAGIEGGTSKQDDEALGALHAIYQPSEEEWSEVQELSRRGKASYSKSSFRYSFKGEPMRQVIDMEHSAVMMRCHNSMTIPGLLQCKPYMRSLFEAYVPANSPAEIDHMMSLRLERQRVLDNPDQHFDFVIDQAALSRMQNMDGSQDQLWHLLELNERPNIDLRFVPFSHGYYLGQEVDFRIFDFEVDPVVQVASVERYDGVSIQHGDPLKRYLTVWEAQVQAGLDPNQAHNFLSFLAGPRRS
jgi:transcriptional regulator with XRE-family HTH domain